MRIAIRSNSHGSTIVVVLVIAAVIGLTLAAYLTWISSQNRMAFRSQTWNAALPLVEAGLEEALTHINSSPPTWATNGFALSGNIYTKQRTLTEGYYIMELSTNTSAPTITCWSYYNAPFNNGYIKRGVRITCLRNYSSGGLLSRGTITMSGGARLDSYDSALGPYNPTNNVSDQLTVGSLSPVADAIHVDTGHIYGKVSMVPGATATVNSGSVGDMAWQSGGNTGFEPGFANNSLTATAPDVSPPNTNGAFTALPPPASIGGVAYIANFNGGTWVLPTTQFSSPAVITAPSVIYCNGAFKTSGSGYVRIMPGASLKVYVTMEFNVSGSAIVNDTLDASNCNVYGMPTANKVVISGSGAFIGQVNAPSATATISGSGGFFGSCICNNAVISGGGGFHYDQNLGAKSKQPYSPNSWTEL